MLAAGTFVGNWVHNQVLGQAWVREVVRCEERARQATADFSSVEASLARISLAAECRAATDTRRVAFSAGGAAVAGMASLVVLGLAPRLIERKRRFRSLDARLEPAAQRMTALAAEIGLATPPTIVLGSTTQRDAFSYGIPGHYRVVLPPAAAVRWRDTGLFVPLVRHELAHLRHRDVPLAWLARSVWYALAPLLMLPLIVTVFSSDRGLLVDYAWRAALLALTVQLVSSALLRSREYDADLRVAAIDGPTAISALVARTRGAADPTSWIRRALAKHPSPSERLSVLQQPDQAAGVTFLDGFTAAFLAGLLIPLIVSVLTILLASTEYAVLAAAFLAGPLLGGSVGLGLWRAALIYRVVGRPLLPGTAALGVGAGLVLGQAVSLAQTATGLLGGLDRPIALILTAVAGVSVTLLTASLGELWANTAPAQRSARMSWVTAAAVNIVLFVAVLWISVSAQTAFDFGGWALTRLWLVTSLASRLTLIAVLVLAAAAAWSLHVGRRAGVTPAWLVESGEPQPWPPTKSVGLLEVVRTGLVSGLAGAVALVAFRILAGPAAGFAEQEQRLGTYFWLAAAVGAAAALTCAALTPRRGAGAAVLAGPLATLTTIAGFLAMNTMLGGDLNLAFVASVIVPPLALGFVLTLLVAPAGLLVRPSAKAQAQPIWPIASAAALMLAVVVLAGRSVLVSQNTDEVLARVPTEGPVADADRFISEPRHYLSVIAPDILTQYTAIEESVTAIDSNTAADGVTRAALIRADLLPAIRTLLAEAEAYQPTTDEVRTVHNSCIAALQTTERAFETFAIAFESGDSLAFDHAQALRQEESQHWSRWQRAVLGLQASITPD